MSQGNPISKPFGSGPVGGPIDGPVDDVPVVQNPFQIVSGGGAGQPQQPASPSPFEAVGNQAPYGTPQGACQVPAPWPPESTAPANPFRIADGQQAAQAQQPAQAQRGQEPAQAHQTGGGFPMKGFPPGPAPMDQLDAAPVQASGGGEIPQEAGPPLSDPFAGMDLPRILESPAETAIAAPPVEDFSAREPTGKPEAEQEAEIELDPKPEPETLPQAKKSVSNKKKKAFVPVRPEAEETINSETKQLELRAIFGVDHELSHQEIRQRTRGLPGIIHVCKVNTKEADALEVLQGCASKLGLEDEESIVMSCPEGFIDFMRMEGTSLAVLRKDKYAPGVRETLIICAREMDKL